MSIQPLQPYPIPGTVFYLLNDMQIILNGEKKDIPALLTVKGLLEHLDIKPERVAVEINEEIVLKATYTDVVVKDGDRVEVVQFMGGGAEGADLKVKG